MPLITLDQILSPLRLDPNDPLRLLMSGSFSVTGSSSGSYYVSSSNIVWQAKINEIITTFDDYEYYLYYLSLLLLILL